MKKRAAGILLVFAVLFTGCGREDSFYTEDVFEPASEFVTEQETQIQVISTEKEKECYVYVCGEVHAPGVYKLPGGSRVYQALQMAGGLTEEADASAVNQALPIEDGQMIQVWAKGEAEKEAQPSQTGEDGGDDKVDLNSADMQALMGIPGIGEAKAKSILSYREEHGSFQSVEDVMNITGIKEGLFSRMKDYITVK